MKVIGFYKKGARVIVEGVAGGGVDRRRSFGGGGGTADVEIGIVPSGSSKPVSGAAHDVVKHNGVEHLALNGGHVYEVVLSVGGVEKNDVISAEPGHVIVPLPKGAVVVSVSAHVVAAVIAEAE